MRLPAGYRVPRDEVLRLARERIEREAGRKLSQRRLERLIDEVIRTNTDRTDRSSSAGPIEGPDDLGP